MINLKSILNITLVATLSLACKKEKTVEPESHSSPQTTTIPFTGVIFFQLKADSIGSYNYGVKKVTAPMTSVYLLPTTGGNGVSNNIYDSLTVNFQSGDSIHVGAWKNDNEPFIEPYIGTGNKNFKIRTKVYFNGALLHDITSINGQYWWKLP